ncbi:hypothetical protein CF326_g7531 [Tilletia indica]|nr:hypothetical protein CF326_g7531 [Tilletia indica]
MENGNSQSAGPSRGSSGSSTPRHLTTARPPHDDSIPPPHIAELLTDAHCHPTDDPRLRSASTSIEHVYQALREHPLGAICIMSSSVDDQQLVRAIATRSQQDSGSGGEQGSRKTNIVPAFGHHPWFVHQISLEDPPLPKKEHYLTLFTKTSDEDDQHHHTPLANAKHSPKADQQQQQQQQEGSSSTDTSRTKEMLELIEYLPEPIALSQVLKTLRADLESFPNAMLGEVGLDRSFRLPWPLQARAARAAAAFEQSNGTSKPMQNSTGRASKLAWTLSSFTTPLSHQLAVLQAQVCLAIDLRRSVSLHSVKAHGATSDFFMHMTRIRPRGWGVGFSDIKIDLHSCTISAPGIIQIQKTHQNVFVSFSTTINTRQKALQEQIRACDPRRLLAESDFNSALPSRPSTYSSAHGEHEDGCSHGFEEDGGDHQQQQNDVEGGPPTLQTYPLARRTWAIVQCMADVLDVRQGVGPGSGTQYGKLGKDRKRNKAAAAAAAAAAALDTSEQEGNLHEAGGPDGTSRSQKEREERQVALAELLANNWSRFLANQTPGAKDDGNGSGHSSDDETDSDDEWDPEARQAALQQRHQQPI